MRQLLLSLAGIVSMCGLLPAQTIHDVITSLSDRQRVIIQRTQVSTQLSNEYGSGSTEIPKDKPINWIGAGENPSAASIEGLGVAGRVALINQAVAEFDVIAASYANISPAELTNATQAGTIDFYRPGDFPPLPRATPENHQEILRQLAQRVRALRVLTWPSVFEKTTYGGSGSAKENLAYDEDQHPYVEVDQTGMSSLSWQPAQIGASILDCDESSPTFSVGTTESAAVTVSGSYDEDPSGDEDYTDPLRTQNLGFSVKYPKRAILRATAQGAEGTQIGGTVRILSRSKWHQLSVSNAPTRFSPANGAFVIEGSGSSGDVSLFSTPPQPELAGTWITTNGGSTENGPWLEKHFVETGYQLKGASLINPTYTGYSDAFHRSYERNWSVGCTFFSLFQPDFTRGVDAATAKTKLDPVNLVLADNTTDGALRLHPRPSLLFGIDLGPGLNGAGDGMLTAGLMADSLENQRGYSGTEWTYAAVGEVIAPVTRFDSSYALRFAGSAVDYHVVYENNRTGRTQSLPQQGWPYTAPGGTAYDSLTLFRDWERPRLKQVVGRDLVANITYNSSHYGGYTVTVYRRPENAAAPVAGQAVAIDNLPVVRTWTFSKPGAGTTAHPTNAEKLLADGLSGEKFEISAQHTLLNNGAAWDSWYDYAHAVWWGGNWTTAWWWYLDGNYQWVLKLSQGEQEKYRKEIGIESTNLSPDPWGYDFEYATTISTFQDGASVGVLTSDTLDPFGDASPSDWKYVAAGKTIIGTPVPADWEDPAFRYGKLATSLGIDYGGVRPDLDAAWDDNGMLETLTEGSWETTGGADGTAWKITRKFNSQTIATEWFEFTGAAALKHYSAPDGASVAKGHSSVAWTEVEVGTLSAGQPGLPHKVSRSDNTGTTFQWTVGADGAGSLVSSEGLLSGGGVTKGTEVTTHWNKRGFTTSASNNLLLGGTLITSGAAVPSGQFTDWGAPLQWKDDFSTVTSSWTFDGNRSRAASMTSALGLSTSLTNYDVLDRPGTVAANGISASHTFTGLTHETGFSGTDIQGGTENTTIRDALGRLTSSNTTWNGVVDNLGLTHGGTTVDVTRTVGSYGTESSKIRQADGSLQKADGPVLPFDGVSGDGLTVSNGLLVSRTEILNEQGLGTGAFEETHTDAWGRVRKVVTPSKSGTGSTTTLIHYSDPDSAFQRVITQEPSGRVLISESDPFNDDGSITRSGIDLNFTSVSAASLGGSDRYTESVTTISGGKLATTLKATDEDGPNVVNGLRKVMYSEWNPATGKTETWINGSEEKITTTPDKPNKTVETTSTKGWTRNTALNSLGLPTTNTLSGTGIPATSLTPTWRADGSLASVSLTLGGETHSAAFNSDGTLSSLTAPGRGNILGGHSISNGVETLTVDGVTTESKLNGTKTTTSGGNVTGKTEELTAAGGLKLTVTPEVGEATETHLNAAFAPTSKTYADDSGESYGYTDELLSSVSLARGGALTFGYSQNSAKDLTTATWPQVTSGPFTIPGLTHGFTYNRSGGIKTVSDPSGARGLAYQNGRLTSTAYTAGLLRGYEIIRNHDTSGRHTSILLKRDGTTIHSTEKAPNGASDQITDLASGGITATPQRDAAGRITGYVWSDGTSNSVTQTWTRGAGGRIEQASSNVPGAPTFDYAPDASSFDARGRRLKCATTGGAWIYQYGINGQLTSAVHPTLGSFSYQFDAIGRRKNDSASQNWANILNQTGDWKNTQPKKLTVTADPSARVWVGIGGATPTEISGFNGSHQVALGTPGASGQWVEWNTLAILEGQGEGAGSPPANPLANPDAKAEKHGAAWVPPTHETLTYDAAGNRQGNAQWDYGWDAKNQLVRARTKDYDTAPQGWDIRFTYDAEGRRVRKHVIELREGERVAEKEITFIWDGWDLLYERHQLPSGLTTLERKYLWGPDIADGAAGGAGGLLLIRETKGNTTAEIIPLYDGTGHVVALTNLNKDLLATYAYGPFGERIHSTGPLAQSNPWRFQTKYLDEETGLYYFGHRYYDPITGQWLSRELLGESESINLYTLTGNDPINFVDRLGLAKVATDGRGNLTTFGKALLAIAKDDPNAARSLLMAAQVNREMAGANVGALIGNGSGGSITNVLNAIETVVGVARSDGRNEWRRIAAEAGTDLYFDDGRASHDIWVDSLFAEYAPAIAASAANAATFNAAQRAASDKLTALQNSPGYKLREIGLATADLPMHLGAALFSGVFATDVTTGSAVTWNGWGNGGFGLAEVSPGERAFAAAMVFLPVGRAEGVVDDFVRVGIRAERSLDDLVGWGGRSGIFESERTLFQATRPRGTGQLYEVTRRTDIDWARMRVGGDQRAIGLTNWEAAERFGLAPELDDGFFATLHHLGQDARGGLIEASTRYHGVGRYGQDILHSQFGRNQPHPFYPIDRRAFDVDTREYWKWRIGQ